MEPVSGYELRFLRGEKIFFLHHSKKSNLEKFLKENYVFLLFSIFIFIFGVIILSFGSKLIVDSSLNLAQKLKLSGIAVGSVFIAMITAIPETFITLLALRKSSMIAFGNLVGSNIINIPLAIGLPALITTPTFSKFDRRISLTMIIATTVAFLLLIDGRLTYLEG